MFPLDKIHKTEYLSELQKPINISVEEIIRDLYKFVKDFPIDIIPHMTEEELQARSKERDLIKPKNYEIMMGGDSKQTNALGYQTHFSNL